VDRPEALLVWGDPQSDEIHPLVRDVNNLANRGIFVGTNGMIQFSNGQVCTVCSAKGPIISVDDEPVIAIRFGPDRDGADRRRPYLASLDDGATYIQILDGQEGIIFEETEVRFEELAANLIVWTDPSSDASTTGVRDVTDSADRHVRIGTDAVVQFHTGEICPNCSLDGRSITVGGVLRMHIRFGPGLNDDTHRWPFLVSDNGFHVALEAGADGLTFVETDRIFETPDDPDDDEAWPGGVEPNPDPGDWPDDDLALRAGYLPNPFVDAPGLIRLSKTSGP
jgi:hypothetical protein